MNSFIHRSIHLIIHQYFVVSAEPRLVTDEPLRVPDKPRLVSDEPRFSHSTPTRLVAYEKRPVAYKNRFVAYENRFVGRNSITYLIHIKQKHITKTNKIDTLRKTMESPILRIDVLSGKYKRL